MKSDLPKTKISRRDYNLLLNWLRVADIQYNNLGVRVIGYSIKSLPVELSYMKTTEYYVILSEWINNKRILEVFDETESDDNLTNSTNQTTLGDVITELQEQFCQVGNIDVNVYDSDDHMVITYE